MIIGQPQLLPEKMNRKSILKNTTVVSLSMKENMDGSITLSLVPKNTPTKKSINKVRINEVPLPVYHHVYGNDLNEVSLIG